jgi:hypothetical protein
MVNVLDVLETIKSSSTTPKKIVETSEVQIEDFGAEALKHQSETEVGPSEPTKVKSLEAEDFLYCLPDSKEISVCREMSKSFGFPTLEDGLSVLSKNELADSLAYNSLKVQKLGLCIIY